MSDYAALLEAINNAGYSYESEWQGDMSDPDARIGHMTIWRGRNKRNVRHFYAADVHTAAAKAAAAIERLTP